MALDQRDEVGRRVACQCGFAEVRIGGEEILRRRAEIGEVAAPAAGHQDLLADAVRVFDDEHAPSALPGGDRAHQPGCAAADDQSIEAVQHVLSAPVLPAPCAAADRS